MLLLDMAAASGVVAVVAVVAIVVLVATAMTAGAIAVVAALLVDLFSSNRLNAAICCSLSPGLIHHSSTPPTPLPFAIAIGL
jgi:fucose permease